MKVIARVTEAGESFDIQVPPASLVEYEVVHDESLPTAVRSGRTRWFCWLAWHAATIRRDEKRTFDDWLKAVDELEDVSPEEGDDTRPTGGGPAAGSAASPASSSGRASTRSSTSSSTTGSRKPSTRKR